MTPTDPPDPESTSGTPSTDASLDVDAPPTPTSAPAPPVLPAGASEPEESSSLGRLTIGFMALGVGGMALFDAALGSAFAPSLHHYIAFAVTILGGGLLVGSIRGRARWLIIVAVVLVPVLVISPVFQWTWVSDAFDNRVQITDFESLDHVYAVDTGKLTIDLRGLPWDGEEVSLTARVDTGSLEVILPQGVGLTGFARVDFGRVRGPDGEITRIGNSRITFSRSGPDGSVTLDLYVDLGNINVRVGE